MLKSLETIYEKYNRRKFVHPDPLEFIYRFDHKEDIEIAGIIASSLAYGSVFQILKSVETALDLLEWKPSHSLKHLSKTAIKKRFNGFRYRFTSGDMMGEFLCAIKTIIEQYGSLEDCFLNGYRKSHDTFLPALTAFADNFINEFHPGYLIPHPSKGSACKRFCLFLRWMIRNDEVDIGCWKALPFAKLIIPLDTHMFKIGTMLGFTTRKHASMKTSLEITEGFKTINKNDPVKYDFSLTRYGIREELTIADLTKCFEK